MSLRDRPFTTRPTGFGSEWSEAWQHRLDANRQSASLAPIIPGHKVITVIPAFNEERFIASVVIEALPYSDEVIVVDDGSLDRTATNAEAAGAMVIRCDTNVGKAGALTVGFRQALASSASVIVCVDGDAQHDPAEIPRLIAPILQGGADVVIGSRYVHGTSRRAIPAWRRWGQGILNLATNTLSGTSVGDTQSGFRAFSAAAAQSLRLRAGGLSVESEMQFAFAAKGLRVAEVGISVNYLDGPKRNPFAHGVSVLNSVVGLVLHRRPLLLIGVPGLFLAGTGVAFGLRVIERVHSTGTIPVELAVITSLVFVGGVVLATTAVSLQAMENLVQRLRAELTHDLLD